MHSSALRCRGRSDQDALVRLLPCCIHDQSNRRTDRGAHTGAKGVHAARFGCIACVIALGVCPTDQPDPHACTESSSDSDAV